MQGWPGALHASLATPQLAVQSDEGEGRVALVFFPWSAREWRRRKDEEARRVHEDEERRFLQSIPEEQLAHRQLQRLVALWDELIEERKNEKQTQSRCRLLRWSCALLV